jgi:Leucine-rich repeat (LRR) protein
LGDNVLLNGTIPPLGTLTALHSLNLTNCSLIGAIPHLAALTALTTLVLSFNRLSTTIPQLDKLTNLVELALGNNELQGAVPDLGELVALTSLDIRSNRLNCTLPALVPSTLKSIVLSGNPSLHGSLPRSWENLSGVLRTLDVSNSALNGTIPTSLVHFTNLQTLRLQGNTLTGLVPALPTNLLKGTSCNLQRAMHPSNRYSCPLPVQWFACHEGNSPSSLSCRCSGTSVNLTTADCSAWINVYDNLQGQNWKACSENREDPCLCVGDGGLQVTCAGERIVGCALPANNLVGVFHSQSWHKFTGLQELNLQHNSLTGTISDDLALASSLTLLNLGFNKLRGTLPPALSSLTQLKAMHLNQNEFSGKIPRTLGGLSSLSLLDLGGNRYTGTIPFELTKLNLQELYLQNNR